MSEYSHVALKYPQECAGESDSSVLERSFLFREFHSTVQEWQYPDRALQNKNEMCDYLPAPIPSLNCPLAIRMYAIVAQGQQRVLQECMWPFS